MARNSRQLVIRLLQLSAQYANQDGRRIVLAALSRLGASNVFASYPTKNPILTVGYTLRVVVKRIEENTDVDSLTAELSEIRDHYHTMNHPLFAEWSQGRLNKRQMGCYLVQHPRITCDRLRAYGLCYEKVPGEVHQSIDFVLGNRIIDDMKLLGD